MKKKLIVMASVLLVMACGKEDAGNNGRLNLDTNQKGQIGKYTITNIGNENVIIEGKIIEKDKLELVLVKGKDKNIRVEKDGIGKNVDFGGDRVEVISLNATITADYGLEHPSANTPQVPTWRNPDDKGNLEIEWNVWYGPKVDQYVILDNGVEIYKSPLLTKPTLEEAQKELFLLSGLSGGDHKLQIVFLYFENGTTYNKKSAEWTKKVLLSGDTGTDRPIGQALVLTDAEIQKEWGGLNPSTMPNAVVNRVSDLISLIGYEELFPRRYGTSGWSEISGVNGEIDYYAYENLQKALTELSRLKLKIYTQGYTQKIVRLDKLTKEEVILKKDPDFGASWVLDKPLTVEIVDYGNFLNEGTLEIKKRELAAFLANISHETTGGWDDAPGGRFSWGLYFKQETNHDDNSVGGYISGSTEYPANKNESYHGRGPIQLSYDYNYGYMSQIIYNDKMVLLNNPDRVANDGVLGYMTGIWFWMTPQAPKPSCHDVMVGNWVPNEADIKANRLPGFGTTINVINGGLEAGKPNDYRVLDRIGFYERYCAYFGVSVGENVDCFTQERF